jgi:hypothetical protein
MLTKDMLFQTNDYTRIWKKYCGFLDLSISEFMEIQEQLLMEQIDLVYGSTLMKELMPEKPKNIAEFRRAVPLTTYENYASYLGEKKEDNLPVKPSLWVHTSGRGGSFKWVPYTEKGMERFGLLCLGLMILTCTERKNEVNVRTGIRILQNVPPPPYMTGVLVHTIPQLLDARIIPPLEKYANVDFETRIRAGFEIALRDGVDLLGSLASVLLKMGERFSESSGGMKFNLSMLQPQILARLITALLRSKREGRAILPKDLWPLKGLICFGTDASIYRKELIHYWGKNPLEIYAATEAGLIATQAWNRKNMTLAPSCCFFEFVPEADWLKNRDDKNYQPSTVLLDEVKPGQIYEIIITSFSGMPFLRYRIGDLIRVVAMQDDETGISLPQITFVSRADDLIDIGGFTRLDERTIWQAIANTGVKYEDWTARKEYEMDKPILRLYLELREAKEARELERLIHTELSNINTDYRNLENMLGTKPLRIFLLPPGSFQRYYDENKKSGADLAHLKPPHMNASDGTVKVLSKIWALH